ncbi:UL16-binding protein 1 [Marmota monax]|uniref:UL16-binding protein 1 n=1 Tax=Marmota monax TaxID=9995 RepID=UPI0026F137EA|nr:UL16-binding protein 1 [Marmota monax]
MAVAHLVPGNVPGQGCKMPSCYDNARHEEALPPAVDLREQTYRDTSLPSSVPRLPLRAMCHRFTSPQQVLDPATAVGATGPKILSHQPNPYSPFSLTGTHSLCYDFTINSKAAPGQQWCTVQGQVDHKNFLSYDCGLDKVKSLSALGGKVSATVTWEEQKATLREMVDMLKQKLADTKAENDLAKTPGKIADQRTRRSPGSQEEISMACWHHLSTKNAMHHITLLWLLAKSSGCTSGSWQFGFNGRMWLCFDSDNKRWTVVHPGSNWMKEKWENDREMTKFLHKTSMGDCRTWLQNLKEWEAELEPTGNWQEGEEVGAAFT